jgi:magnesium-transporting ATPase (P-type)
MTIELKNVWNVTLLIFILTIISNGIAVIYQQTLLAAYGVDPEVINIQIDMGYLLQSVLIMSAISVLLVALYLYLKALSNIPKWFGKFKKVTTIVFDIIILLLLSLVIFFFINDEGIFPDEVNNTINFWITIATGGILIMYILLKTFVIIYEKQKNKKKISESYFEITSGIFSKQSNGILMGKVSKIPLWPVILIIAMVFAATLPASMAQRRYENQKVFTAIVNESPKNEEPVEQLVILRTGNTLIVKEYNTETKRFLDSYKLVENKELVFKAFDTK